MNTRTKISIWVNRCWITSQDKKGKNRAIHCTVLCFTFYKYVNPEPNVKAFFTYICHFYDIHRWMNTLTAMQTITRLYTEKCSPSYIMHMEEINLCSTSVWSCSLHHNGNRMPQWKCMWWTKVYLLHQWLSETDNKTVLALYDDVNLMHFVIEIYPGFSSMVHISTLCE